MRLARRADSVPGSVDPPKNGVLASIEQKFCSVIPDARTLTLKAGIGAVGSTQGSLQASLDYEVAEQVFPPVAASNSDATVLPPPRFQRALCMVRATVIVL